METSSNRPYWWQFFFLALGMIGYTICRTGFPVGLAAMGRQFHWTAFEAGVLATIFLLGQALVDIPAGYWVDRFDRKLVIFVGLFGIGLFTILVTFSTGFWSAFIYRVVFGMLEGCYNIAQFAVAGSILPGNRALVNGLTQVFYGIGSFGGQQIVGRFLHGNAANWQLPLWWLGGLTMGYAVISLGLFQRQYLRRYESNTATVQLGFWPTFGNALGNVRVWKALAITAANSMANWTIQGLGNYIFIRYRHYDPIFTAFVFGGGGAIGGLFVPLGTVWADRLGRRPVVAVLGLFTAVVLGLLFYAAPPNWTMVVLSACGSFGISSVYSLGYTITQDAIASVSMSGIGIATGMAGGVGYLFAALAGPIVGALVSVVGQLWAMNIVCVGTELLVFIFALWFLKGAPQPGRPGVVAAQRT